MTTEATNDDRGSARGTGGSVLRRAARSATAPVRGYLNDHFEMVKDEVRLAGAGAGAGAGAASSDPEAWARVAELESLLAEQSVHQARVMARVADEVADMSGRIADLERVVRLLAALVAPPSTDEPGEPLLPDEAAADSSAADAHPADPS